MKRNVHVLLSEADTTMVYLYGATLYADRYGDVFRTMMKEKMRMLEVAIA